MNTDALNKLAKEYGLEKARTEAHGSGLINRTWKLYERNNIYLLQKINDHVFKRPQDIAHNIRLISSYLKETHPSYFFISPVKTKRGEELVFIETEGWFRLFPFVKNSVTIDVVSNPPEAFEAASQFARFTRLLSGFDAGQLKTTIPGFHNLQLRYDQFLNAISQGNPMRINESQQLIEQLIKNKKIVDQYVAIMRDPGFKLRTMHHDTKISNVLFDEKGKALCVIDLDTIMPGYYMSDLGDMIRTYISPGGEEEGDLSKISIRKEIYAAIVNGYLSEMGDELTTKEKSNFLYAGKFMIYMQALRFLTDYLNNDRYYGAKYEGHNLVRAKNQFMLLRQLVENEKYLFM